MTGRRPIALVTGGCRRVGAAIAARLGEGGYDLALHGGHRLDPDPELIARLDRAGAAYRLLRADLSIAAQVDGLINDAAAAFGRPVRLLVNNASRFDANEAGLPDMAALIDYFAVNAAAPFRLAVRLAAQADDNADAAGGRAVVNLLDQRIDYPNHDQIAYTLSKQALAAATRTLAVALAPGVRVNGVAPGLTLPTADYDAVQMERLASMMPLRRLPNPADIAEAVHYLATAPAVTGQTLFVDGGAAMTGFDRDFVNLARD
ncbi:MULTISPECIES: SDR family oxidoreductase [unclassified Sphingomonas]|uniref:SDR family oxidoreductase n=1 Tax=unclassified Sphingomonas TaxID=196159 RepID=UPI000830C93C|nr:MULTISPECIES: SDR family oxidoreductase [unclassified Sphingomonas]